jgi:hypothetical protein
MLATGIVDAATVGTGAMGDEFASRGVAYGVKAGYTAGNVTANHFDVFDEE